jgi:hypothetical protein
MPDDFEKLTPEFLALARRIFDAGRKMEHDRMAGLLRAALSDEGLVAMVHTAHQRGRTTGASHGSVSVPVREALRELSARTPDGVGAADIAASFESRIGGGPTERQVRAALKQLHKVGEAIRLERGRYLSRDAAPAQPSGEVPDGDASGGFPLAAE